MPKTPQMMVQRITGVFDALEGGPAYRIWIFGVALYLLGLTIGLAIGKVLL